jgi:hypothetical protein
VAKPPKELLDLLKPYGTGKQMRHIKIRNMSDLLRPSVRAYLQEACERAGYEVASEKAKTVSTVLKRKSLPKTAIGTATS